MLTATRLIPAADRPRTAPLDTLTLDHAARHKRRARVTTDGGRDVFIDLPQAAHLAAGDALAVDGGFIEVRAAAEPLLEIRCGDALALARIAWHLGNRHAAAEITPDAIYIEPDHVLAAMVAGLGASVRQVHRPFEPEGGAYGGHGHHHSHG